MKRFKFYEYKIKNNELTTHHQKSRKLPRDSDKCRHSKKSHLTYCQKNQVP